MATRKSKETVGEVVTRLQTAEDTIFLDQPPAQQEIGWLRHLTETKLGWCLFGLSLVVATGLGMVTKPLIQRQTEAAQMAKALQTGVPTIRALDVAIDPGKYLGKMVDVVMSPTRGGVYKSGKGLYLQESPDGMSIVVFESAFQSFVTAWELTRPEDIPARLIGKYIRARGVVTKYGERLSMIVYAPGLISEIPLP